MRNMTLLAAWPCWRCESARAPRCAQKSGGILKMYHRDNPPTLSIHETATNSTMIPIMPVMNNLVLFDQSKPQNSQQSIVPDLAKSWSWSADGKDLTFKLRGRREVARRQAVHRQGRRLHVRPPDGQDREQAARQPARLLVRQRRERHGRQRPAGDHPSQAAAAVAAHAARLGLLTDLRLPRHAGADAHQSRSARGPSSSSSSGRTKA